MDEHQNLKYDFLSESRVWMNIKIKVLDLIQNLSMNEHQNLEYDFSSKSKITMNIKI